jgi:solute carrier family 50 (sugar transporter)
MNISAASEHFLGFTFGVIQMALYMFYMNKTPVAAEGKQAGAKLPAGTEDHVVNIAKLSPALPEKSREVHPVTEMGIPRWNCAAVAAPANRGAFATHSPAVGVVWRLACAGRV